jgi:hypothetical protein
MTNINQMELGLSTAQRLANSLNHRRRRANRARWWFAQMRRAVDSALDWQPAPPVPPERLSGRIQAPPAASHRI